MMFERAKPRPLPILIDPREREIKAIARPAFWLGALEEAMVVLGIAAAIVAAVLGVLW